MHCFFQFFSVIILDGKPIIFSKSGCIFPIFSQHLKTSLLKGVYHFFLNGAPLTVNPTNDSSFSMTTLSNGDKISVRVVDVSGCISTNSKTFTVNQTPNSGGGGTLVDMQGSVAGEVEESTEFQIDRIQITNNNSKLDLVNVFLGTASIPGKEFIVTKDGPEFVLQDDFVSNNDKIKITRFDYQRQDDAKNVVFKEDQSLQAFGISAESHVNLSTMKSPFYEIIMRVNSLSNPSLYFSVGCGNNCRGSIELPTKLMTDWSTINIPLSCLEKDGLDKTKIQVRGLFLSEEEINFDLNSIVIKDGKLTGKEVRC